MHNHLQLTFKLTKTIIKGLLNYTLANFLSILIATRHKYTESYWSYRCSNRLQCFEDNKVSTALKKNQLRYIFIATPHPFFQSHSNQTNAKAISRR